MIVIIGERCGAGCSAAEDGRSIRSEGQKGVVTITHHNHISLITITVTNTAQLSDHVGYEESEQARVRTGTENVPVRMYDVDILPI